MTAHQSHFDVVLMSRALSVSRSGYYSWMRRPPSAQAQDNVALDAAITDVFWLQILSACILKNALIQAFLAPIPHPPRRQLSTH